MPPVRSFSFEESRVTSILCAVAFGRDRAGIDIGEAENGMQHRRFAGAVRADQAQRLLVADAQAEPVQDFHLPVAGVQIVDAQMRCCRRPARRVPRRRRRARFRAPGAPLPRPKSPAPRRHDSRRAAGSSARHQVRSQIGVDDALVALDFAGLAVRQHLAMRHAVDLAGRVHDHAHVVLDDEQRDAEFGVGALEPVKQPVDQRRIDAGGRLVEQQHGRLVHQRHGEFQQLLLAERERLPERRSRFSYSPTKARSCSARSTISPRS